MKKIFSLFSLVVIGFSMMLFSACDVSYEDISLAPSQTSIELAVGEEKTFDVEIKNYNSEISNVLSINNPDNIISIEETEVNKGKTFVTIKGLRVGETILDVRSLEGNKQCKITINVYQKISEIVVSDSPYVLKTEGNFVRFESAGFVHFSPNSARGEEVIYTYRYMGIDEVVTSAKVEGGILYLLTDKEDEIPVPGQIMSLTAKVDDSLEIEPKTFQVDILSPIITGDLKYIKKGLGTNYLSQAEVVSEPITLVSNLSANCYYEFELECESDVEIKVTTAKNIASKVNIPLSDYQPTSIHSRFLYLQADLVGNDTLTIELYYKNYPAYVETLTYEVKTTSSPTSIAVNNKTVFADTIVLFDTFSGASGLFAMLPTIYKTDSHFDTLDFKVFASLGTNPQPLNNWGNYIDVRYKNIPMTQNFSIPSTDFKDNALKNTIYVYGKSQISKFYIVLEVKSSLLLDNVVSISIPIEIKQGVKTLTVDNAYKDGIYLDIEKGTQNARIISYTSSSAYVNGVSVAYLGNASDFVEATAEVTTLGKVTLKLTPKAMGEATISVIMPNGILVGVKIFVEKSVARSDVHLEMGDNANNASITQIQESSGNVTSIAMRFIENDKDENHITDLHLETNDSNLYSVNARVQQSANVLKFDLQELSFELFSVGTSNIRISVTLYEIQNFQKRMLSNPLTFNVSVISYSPITEIFFTQDEDEVTKVSTYRESDVGYEYAQLGFAKTTFTVDARRADGTKLGENASFGIRGQYQISSNGQINNFGSYTKNGNTYTLGCNSNFAIAGSTFWLQFSITEYGVTTTDVINVIIEEYNPLYSIGFYNYVSDLYLSASNPTYTFQTFMDSEADCQEFDVVFTVNGEENRDLFNIEVSSDFSSVKISHNSNAGGGKGVLYFIPICAYYLDNDRVKFAYYQTINLSYGDGSEENPEPISTTQQFATAIMSHPDKHYLITTNLDLSQLASKYNYQFGQYILSGSIVGSNSSIRLLNLSVNVATHDGTENTYAGLFKMITGKVRSISFEGALNLNVENDHANYIGLLAGQNSGLIENCSFLFTDSNIQITAYDPLKTLTTVAVGGVVGLNTGVIKNNVSSNPNDTISNMVKHLNAQKITYSGYSQNTRYGAIAGENNGVIARTVEDKNLVLFNDNINSLIVNIETSGFSNVGGVAGVHEYKTLNANGYTSSIISGHLITGTIKAERHSLDGENNYGAENVGGIVGYNNSYIDDSIVRTTIKGFNNVGGVAGFDKRVNDYSGSNAEGHMFITNCKVQAVKTTVFAPMIMATTTASSNVGAISGNETSVINKDVYGPTNSATYFYDIDINSKQYPVVYNSVVAGTYDSVKYSDQDQYFNLFRKSEAVIKVEKIAGTAQKLTVDQAFDNKVAMLMYYEAENTAEQKYIEHLNKNIDIPFIFENPDSITINSLTPSILVVNSLGKIEIRTTGLATLVVTSILDNTKIDYVYIYVINAFDSFALGNSVKEPIVTSEWNIYVGKPLTLQYFFTHSNIETIDDYAQTISVPLKASTTPSIEYTSEAEGYISIKISGNIITFTALPVDGETVTKLITIKPKFEVNLTGIGSATLGENQLNEIITESTTSLELLMSAKKGTSEIRSNISNTKVEPIDSIDVQITQTTDFDGDYLKIYSYKETSSVDTNNDYFIITNFSGYEYDESNNVYKLSAISNNTNFGSFSFVFNYEKYLISDYAGNYAIIFEADNGYSIELQITLETQKVNNLNIKNYYDVTTTFDATKLQSDYMASGALNLMIVEFYPYFADYDYLYIKNGPQNAEKDNFILFELYTLGENGKLSFLNGVTSTNDGIKIPKSIIEALAIDETLSKLYVLYSTTSKTTIDSQARIELEVVKVEDNSEKIVFETEKAVTIIIKDNVSFSIANRQATDLKNYVAKGLSYDLNLSIYGFEESEMVIEATYGNYKTTINPFDGEIDTQSPVDIVYSDGYQLVVNRDIVYQNGAEGLEVEIASYGRSMSDNLEYTSGKSYLNIVVVDVVVLTDNIRPFVQGGSENISEYTANTVIAGTENAILNLSVGNRHTLSVGLQNGITVEYDGDNSRTVALVQAFEQSLTNNGEWKVKADALGVVGKYVREVALNQNTNLTTDYFKITGMLNGNNIEINYVPLKITDYDNPMYYFSYGAKFTYKNGIPTFANLNDEYAFDLSSDFVPDIYPNSTEENAIPVSTYEELLAMENGGHYIMLSDIQLPTTHAPLFTEVASLDGNGYSIILPSALTFDGSDDVGVFGTIEQSTILKNITIKIPTQTRITLTTTESVNFGLLAGRNLGSITNCQISCSDYVQVSVILPNQTTDTSENYVAGLVAVNDGTITNSRVKVNLSGIANIAGFVCENSGKIASSYVKNSFISNSGSAHYHSTAGFVLKNGLSATSQNAQIISCYVLGEATTQGVYSTSKLYYINSNPNASGFVYENYCKISDCFSDIYINSSATRTGFALANAGEITNSYATCSFNENNGRNTHAFICNNYTGDSQSKNEGVLKSCFYLNLADNAETEGLTGLTASKFADSSVFENFIFSSNIDKTEGIWFYPASGNELFFTLNGNSQVFTPNKPQLVSPNIITNSMRAQDPNLTTVDTETGETIYVYYETLSESGTTYNPILLSSAETLENIFIQNSSGGVNNKTYRLISDITFSETSNITSLNKLTFTGSIEGNGLSLSGFTINSKDTNKNGGLFAQIGQGYSNTGVVKNLTLAPKYLNFPNTQNVGTLAGLLEGGKIYNITVDGFKNSVSGGVAVYGVNNVGGVIGVACNDFQIIGVQSSVSAKATYDHIKASKPLGEFTNALQSSNCSYAGAVLGVAYGGGTISNISVVNATRSSAEIAGLLIGKVGKNVIVENISQEISNTQYLNATAYGGIIAGENSGEIRNANVFGTAKTDFFNITDTQNLPIAVGGIVGLQTNGSLKNTSISLDFAWSQISPPVVGGIAGEVLAGTLSDVDFEGDISIKAETNVGAISKVVVGGVIGQILSTQSTTMTKELPAGAVVLKNIYADGNINVSSINILKTITGGIVGKIVNDLSATTSTLTTKYKHTFNNVHNDMDLSVDSIIYNGTLESFTGGLVGAVFSDGQENYAGEVLILDSEHENESTAMLQSTSNSKISINIQDMKGSASANVYYGGIAGYGYTVASYTNVAIISGAVETNVKITPWGVILGNQAKNTTNPEYAGMFYEEEGNKIYYTTMKESEFLTLISNSQTQEFENN